MRRLLLAIALTAASGLAAFAVSAQSAPAADPQAKPAEASADGQTPRPISDRHCLRHTGSLIRADRAGKRGCNPVAGRAYDRDDIDRTGAIDLADALRRLDPAVH
ncbi:hypothetical protein [Vulcaniibacterium tengchongense]|uniref:Uncharacterized protein n=1 Tax=Vulcaniibacterium tengchongense TaxID=1273429 RepID=A0A3N4V2P1_9GAMM|nr:hypothetical protein [Vulcaniibacterium tengchongense]RPE77242.1 hypothetical protein EDC50_2508 [Vulcaniibacterium tengchongense]